MASKNLTKPQIAILGAFWVILVSQKGHSSEVESFLAFAEILANLYMVISYIHIKFGHFLSTKKPIAPKNSDHTTTGHFE